MRLEHWFYKLPLRLRSLFRRSQVENELSEELQYHLDRQTEILGEQGMSPEEARAAALRSMSGLEQQKEKCRDARGVGLIEDLISDARYALRSFQKSLSLVSVIVASLALGIGANTAIFSVMNAVSLKMLPVRDPGRLVLLNWSSKAWPEPFVESVEGNTDRAGGVMSSDSFASDSYAKQRPNRKCPAERQRGIGASASRRWRFLRRPRRLSQFGTRNPAQRRLTIQCTRGGGFAGILAQALRRRYRSLR